MSYSKPPSYSEFLTKLDAACTEGDKLAQQAIERLAPEMAKELRRHKEWGKPKLCIEVAEGNVNVLQDADTLANPDPELPAKLIQHILGSVEEYVQNSDSGPEEYSEAVAALITDMTVESRGSTPVSKGSIEHDGKSIPVSHILKDMQPHREKPSKNRGTRFAAGELVADKEVSKEHDLRENQYWLLHPQHCELRRAKVVLVGQILCILKEGKICKSSCANNPSTSVIATVYEYNPTTEFYTPKGRTGMLSACSSLIRDATHFVTKTTEKIKLNLESMPDMKDYVPYHADMDIQKRLHQDGTASVNTDCTDQSNEPYLVEKVVKKRFSKHRNQYEYWIKWQGYTSSENTWELPENIPTNVLAEFEKQLLAASSQTSEPCRSGLRQNRKVAHKADYILNY